MSGFVTCPSPSADGPHREVPGSATGPGAAPLSQGASALHRASSSTLAHWLMFGSSLGGRCARGALSR